MVRLVLFFVVVTSLPALLQAQERTELAPLFIEQPREEQPPKYLPGIDAQFLRDGLLVRGVDEDSPLRRMRKPRVSDADYALEPDDTEVSRSNDDTQLV